jgi:hypothetical protein
MPERDIDPASPDRDEDWYGNNAAFTCPACSQVFVVSGYLDRDEGRRCPRCDSAKGYVRGSSSKAPDSRAWIEW